MSGRDINPVRFPDTMKAVVYREFGGPEVLHCEEVATPQAGPDEVLVKVLAVAIDYIQLHIRRGGSGRIGSARESSYGIAGPPYFPGGTACVEVAALGTNAKGVELGSRHLVGGLRPGSCVEWAVVDAKALQPRPDGRPGTTACPPSFTPEQVAAFGYAPVAYHTLKIAAGLKAGETVLLHAAAGGTGVLAIQLAKSFGARVLATAGSPEKLDLTRELGADLAINYRTDDFVAAVLEATSGRGVEVVWESVGGEVFTQSLNCMAEGGRMVSFGSNTFTGTGQVDFWPFWVKNLKLIGWGGSSNAEAHTPEIMEALIDLAQADRLRPVVRHVYPFGDASSAHRLIEERLSIGKVLLRP
ncbi:MAG: zinc-binding dehydrogenase [Gemmatimonadetes bacterium]|nr:zinc-binding dehydrogenase [Gemmatimonadota bacterium]MXZ08142.1 zinc-binding dehydrogenase [Gemmatimonadota bacterium]MYF16167.1 zinc-binding dehydrogenase [Gemmatimonadota bacterium]